MRLAARTASIDSMFIALRDLQFAKGRFALLGSVIALMTFMVVMLSGLTAGLGSASVSAVGRLPVDHIALQQPPNGQSASFSTSALPADTARQLAAQPGVAAAHPMGLATSQLTAGSSTQAVTVFGGDPALYPDLRAGHQPGPGQIAVTRALADDASLEPGDSEDLAGRQLTVTAILADTSFNHLPVVYTGIDTWQLIAHTDAITAVGLRLNGATAAQIGTATNVHVISKQSAFGAVGSYSAEQGSLNLMRVLLVAVSVLIVGSFFAVWTMQRSGDLAVVRALGGSRAYLLRDALGQAALVLITGATAGAAAAAAAGLVAARAAPFLLTWPTVTLPIAAMAGVGLLGAALSVRKVTNADPLTALGAVK